MLEISDKNVCFLQKYGLQKLELELRNTNHKSLNRTLVNF